MVYQTNVSLWQTEDVRIRQQVAGAPDGRVLNLEFPGGTSLLFMGPKGKLLAMFRAIETSLLEGDEDADIFFGERDETEELFPL